MNKVIAALIVFSALLCSNPLFAQWAQTNGPYGGWVNALAISGTNLFAGTGGGGLSFHQQRHKLDCGQFWLDEYLCRRPYCLGHESLCRTGGGVFLSTNNGTSWTVVNSGLTNTYVRALTVSGTNLFAGTNGGVFLSTNNGTSWTAVNSGLPNTYVYALTVSGTNLFAGTGGGVFLSTNNGTSWTAVNSGLPNTYVFSLTVSGTNLFAGTYVTASFFPPITVQAGLRSILACPILLSTPLPSQARISLPELMTASFFPPITAQAGLRSILA